PVRAGSGNRRPAAAGGRFAPAGGGSRGAREVAPQRGGVGALRGGSGRLRRGGRSLARSGGFRAAPKRTTDGERMFVCDRGAYSAPIAQRNPAPEMMVRLGCIRCTYRTIIHQEAMVVRLGTAEAGRVGAGRARTSSDGLGRARTGLSAGHPRGGRRERRGRR